MPFKIQRVPRGLNDLLGIFGGETPTELEDRARLTLDAWQLYGSTQLQQFQNSDAALAENGQITFTPSATNWTVVFSGCVNITQTATMTAYHGSVSHSVLGSTIATATPIFSTQIDLFGATVTGTIRRPWVFPYPRLFPPGTRWFYNLDILGTDATANQSFQIVAGVL